MLGQVDMLAAPLLLLDCFALQEGLKYMFQDRSLVTVWSAPNYCYRCGNVASMLCFDAALEREVKYFTETDENSNMMAPRAAVPYFL